MHNSKILIIAAISLFALNANAGIVETGTCNSAKTCKYELDDKGNLRVYGSGEIGVNAFNGKQDITNVVIEKGITSIESQAFMFSGLKNVSIANTVTSIGDFAFYAVGLKTIVIPKSVTSMGSSAFIYTILTDVTIEGTNVSIGDSSSVEYGLHWGNVNFNVVPGSNTEKRLKELHGSNSRAKFHAYIPPKRTHYTIEEAMEHVSHDNHNTITFTFK